MSLQAQKEQDINYVHKLFGHCSTDTIKNTAKYYNFELKQDTQLEPCSMCKLANARQSDVAKETHTKATKPGERFYVDSTSVKDTGFGGYNFALGILDGFTDYAFAALLKQRVIKTR